MTDGNLITSKDILDKTGISRATLNNYIKLGILPRPIISSPGPEQHGVKQIGYFPKEALDSIERVKELKRQGNSMSKIAEMFQRNASLYLPAEPEKTDDAEEKWQQAGSFSDEHSREDDTRELRVTIDKINSPAYLINNNFEIEWINNQAEELLFNNRVSKLVDTEQRNIFRLLLGQKLHTHLHNWQEVLILHFTVLQKQIENSAHKQLYKKVTSEDSRLLSDLFKNRQQPAIDNLYRLPITIATDSTDMKSFLVHTIAFREGTFFVFIPADNINSDLFAMLAQREQIINELLKNRMPSLVSLCSLVADFQDSVKIRAELLPTQYFELINGLWQAVGPVFEKHNGIYGNHAGDGMLYYFVNNHGHNYLSNAIDCALELREVMMEFSDFWRRRKGWDNQLFLNIGINEGQEFFGTIHSTGSIAFTALGDSINISCQLSEFARNGEILATKNLISKLSREDRCRVRYGVQQKTKDGNVLLHGSFSRIGDLTSIDSPDFSNLSSISDLPITTISEKIDTLLCSTERRVV
ncbi:MAG: hypothetical protein GQ559_06755 [Desulfobulbaceae bacterium]|nr:hypothetical protein [Desulfobulbaceae bacterium]